jgi:very-short-patch-repair endonuclease
MPIEGIIRGQKVDRELQQRAKQFRREMTIPERVLWQELRAGRLDGLRFRRQQIIGGYIVDFYCHSASLIVEVDGPIHDTADMRDHDAIRTESLTLRDLRVLRVTNADVLHNLDDVLQRIKTAANNKQ